MERETLISIKEKLNGMIKENRARAKATKKVEDWWVIVGMNRGLKEAKKLIEDELKK